MILMWTLLWVALYLVVGSGIARLAIRFSIPVLYPESVTLELEPITNGSEVESVQAKACIFLWPVQLVVWTIGCLIWVGSTISNALLSVVMPKPKPKKEETTLEDEIAKTEELLRRMDVALHGEKADTGGAK